MTETFDVDISEILNDKNFNMSPSYWAAKKEFEKNFSNLVYGLDNGAIYLDKQVRKCLFYLANGSLHDRGIKFYERFSPKTLGDEHGFAREIMAVIMLTKDVDTDVFKKYIRQDMWTSANIQDFLSEDDIQFLYELAEEYKA